MNQCTSATGSARYVQAASTKRCGSASSQRSATVSRQRLRSSLTTQRGRDARARRAAPVKAGSRFSRNAATPSRKSRVRSSSRLRRRLELELLARSVDVSAASSSRFVSHTARVGIAAKSSRDLLRARGELVGGDDLRDERPTARASSAGRRRPVVSHSNARAVPSSARARATCRRSPATSPMLTNAARRSRASRAMRTSHASASERPAPAAGPLTAAITGFSSARIASTFRW